MPDELITEISGLIKQARQADKRYFKIKEAKVYANVDDETFSKWRKQGLIPVSVIGGVKRVKRDDIDELMLKHKFGGIN